MRSKRLTGWHRRKARVRKKIFGTPERLRLNVYRSNRHIYAQIINDIEGRTVISASTLTPELRDALKGLKKTEAAKKVGEYLGELAKKEGIERLVFDRGGYLYHGRVRALADGVRSAGINF